AKQRQQLQARRDEGADSRHRHRKAKLGGRSLAFFRLSDQAFERVLEDLRLQTKGPKRFERRKVCRIVDQDSAQRLLRWVFLASSRFVRGDALGDLLGDLADRLICEKYAFDGGVPVDRDRALVSRRLRQTKVRETFLRGFRGGSGFAGRGLCL